MWILFNQRIILPLQRQNNTLGCSLGFLQKAQRAAAAR